MAHQQAMTRCLTWTAQVRQAVCKVSEDVILPSAVIYSSGGETQSDSKSAVVKIRNETQGLIIYIVPEFLEGTPAETRTHDTQSISKVFERTLAPSESVKIQRTLRLRTMKHLVAHSNTPYPTKVTLSSATERDWILSRKSIIRTEKSKVFFTGNTPWRNVLYKRHSPRNCPNVNKPGRRTCSWQHGITWES